MMNTRTLRQKLSRVFRQWRREEYDLALREVEELLKSWPGNPQLYILRASLAQLQEQPTYSLDDVKNALVHAVDLDGTSPAAAIELGHFLDAVDDDPRAASRTFAEAVTSARRLLIEGLLGQAGALLQLGRRAQALKCVTEALYVAEMDRPAGKSVDETPDVLIRDATGRLLALQLKGPFAVKIEELLDEVFPRESA